MYADPYGAFPWLPAMIGAGIGALLGALYYSLGAYCGAWEWSWPDFAKAMGLGALAGGTLGGLWGAWGAGGLGAGALGAGKFGAGKLGSLFGKLFGKKPVGGIGRDFEGYL